MQGIKGNIMFHKYAFANNTYFYVYECLLVCVYVNHMHAWCSLSLEDDVRSPGTTELQIVVTYHVDSGNQTGTSTRAASALDHNLAN